MEAVGDVWTVHVDVDDNKLRFILTSFYLLCLHHHIVTQHAQGFGRFKALLTRGRSTVWSDTEDVTLIYQLCGHGVILFVDSRHRRSMIAERNCCLGRRSCPGCVAVLVLA